LFAGYYVWDRYVHLGDQSLAEMNEARLEGAIHLDPRDPEVRITLAESYLGMGQYAGALEQAEQVLDLYPEHEAALLIAGIAHARLNQPDRALGPLQRFVALRKEQPMARSDSALETAYYFLGESHMSLGQPAQAIPALEGALMINAVDADALFQLGLAYYATGQPEMALQNYRQAVRLVPDFAEAYQAMAEGYAVLGQDDHAAYARGMAAYSQRDYRSAVSYLEQSTQVLPEFAPAFLGLGLTYERMGRLPAALAAVQRAVDLDPNDFAAQQAMGRIQATLDSQN